MNISHRTRALLNDEAQRIQSWLDRFYPPDNGEARKAVLGRTGEYIVVKNVPLPDRYRPDFIDMLLLVDKFPSMPPIGIYVLNQGNERMVAQISHRFNAFQDAAYHEAPSINGFTWVCYHYGANSWRYDVNMPSRSDNLRKFLESFYAELA